MAPTLTTPLCKLLGITHPIMLAGMNVAAGPDLVCAVSNAGGLGVFGGVHYSPRMLKSKLDEVREGLATPDTPFGVDLALPQVGSGARSTNKDYTHGKLDELIDLIIAAKPVLFVSAVGVPPKRIVDKLHKANILVMNMVGHPKHVIKALNVGADLICAQGGEGGGHTGDIPFTVLIPEIVEMCKTRISPLTGQPVQVVAAGAVYNGKSLAAALAYGATGVWVGTRFVNSVEAGVSDRHKQAVQNASYGGVVRTLIYSGRPLSVGITDEVRDWHENRQQELKELLDKGVVPISGEDEPEKMPFLMGQVAAAINDVKPAKAIVEEMVAEAIQQLALSAGYLSTTTLIRSRL